MLPPNVFGDDVFYMNFIVTSVFDEAQRDAYYKIVPCCERCFLFAKDNKLPEARLAFNEVKLYKGLITPGLLPWMKLFCTSFTSYYYYKKRDYKKAIRLINEGVTAIQLLHKNGFQYLFFAEVQQLHNMSRIYFAMNETGRAIEFCIEAVTRIYQQSFLFNTDKMIGNVPEKELIHNCQYAMLIQVIAETYNRILIQFNKKIHDRKRWLACFTGPLKQINFSSMSVQPRYVIFDELIAFMDKAVNSDGCDLDEEVYLCFVNNPYINKPLLKVVYNYLASS